MINFSSNKKYGFTLAEILITLGIIGVVAAMTIPTLMMNYQKQVWESKLKKVYSVATNACERMLIEENVSAVNETEVYNDISNDTLRKYFKLMSNGGAVANRGFSIVLPDSAILYINASNNGFDFFTDVNGLETRPNEAGRDLFAFRLDKDCTFDTDLNNNSLDAQAAADFQVVVENDWKIPDAYEAVNNGGEAVNNGGEAVNNGGSD